MWNWHRIKHRGFQPNHMRTLVSHECQKERCHGGTYFFEVGEVRALFDFGHCNRFRFRLLPRVQSKTILLFEVQHPSHTMNYSIIWISNIQQWILNRTYIIKVMEPHPLRKKSKLPIKLWTSCKNKIFLPLSPPHPTPPHGQWKAVWVNMHAFKMYVRLLATINYP